MRISLRRFMGTQNGGDFLLATGATTGATSSAQVFTTGLGVGTSGAPATLMEVSQATDGPKIRITSRQNDSAHVTSSPYASYEIYKADASGFGAGVASAWRAYPSGATGAGADVAFSVNTGATPGEVEVLFLNSSKNAGVGSASTTNKFQVYDSTYGNLIQVIPNAMNGYGFDVGGCGLIITGGTDATGQDAGFVLRNEQSNNKWVIGMDASDSDAFHISTPNFNASNILTLLSSGYMGVGIDVPTAVIHTAASTTTRASLRIPSGSAPTTPNAGDIWYLTAGRLQVYRAATETIASGVTGAAFTQTYSTADRTLGAYTADNESSAYTGIDNAQGGTVYAQLTDLNALRTAYENLRAFTEDVAQMLNASVDDLQAFGISG